jgi:hypothetical protein
MQITIAERIALWAISSKWALPQREQEGRDSALFDPDPEPDPDPENLGSWSIDPQDSETGEGTGAGAEMWLKD